MIPVTTEDVRPAGPPDECLYCGRKIGELHKADCVVPQKRVRLRVEITVDVWKPWSWGRDTINFTLNESSYCLDNLIMDIAKAREESEGENSCFCSQTTAEVIGVVDDTPQRGHGAAKPDDRTPQPLQE